MNTDALRELRKMVAAGAFPGDIFGSSFGPNIAILTPYEAFSGSLDAAKALHEAMLPGWRVDDMHQRPFGRWQVCIERVADFVEVTVIDYSPARAWLLAILDALIAKDASND